jgi:hypothetical protein
MVYKRAHLKAALLELNEVVRKQLIKIADKHKVKEMQLLGIWITMIIKSVFGVPKDFQS